MSGVVELAVDNAATYRLIIHSCDADVTADNNNDSPRQSEQPPQEPNHVHFFFHGSLLAAHHCFLHPAMIAKEVCCLSPHCRVITNCTCLQRST